MRASQTNALRLDILGSRYVAVPCTNDETYETRRI